MPDSQTTKPLREVLKEFSQAWMWSPGIGDWILVYDPSDLEPEYLDLQAVGIPTPDWEPKP